MPIAVVTGASGYIAGWIIKKLLEKGYEVRGTVRSLADEEKTKPLRELFPALKLYEADLLKEGSFDEAVQGAEIVFHTASPFFVTPKDAQRELVDPALHGTKNILNAVDKTTTVRRVLVTSSIAAVAGKRAEGHVFSEADWNMDSTVDSEPYRFSKRVAEEAAWAQAEAKSWDLVVVNPAAVIGPVLSSRADATSIKQAKALLDGSYLEKGVPPTAFGVVDVRDVAEAHIAAAEVKSANGRYLVTSERGIPVLELVDMLKKSGKFSEYPLPTKVNGIIATPPRFNVDKVKKDLGIQFTPLEQSMVEFVESLIHFEIVKK